MKLLKGIKDEKDMIEPQNDIGSLLDWSIRSGLEWLIKFNPLKCKDMQYVYVYFRRFGMKAPYKQCGE
jgi:hypothetical protein